jgi:predicted PhzF superfamily epimerase YddE/YHI9
LATILDYKKNEIVFETLSGDLIVKIENGIYKLDFPSRMPVSASLPPNISKSLNTQPKVVLKSRDYVLVYENEAEIRNIKIDRQLFDQTNLNHGGVIVTAKGDSCDFVSRFFTPRHKNEGIRPRNAQQSPELPSACSQINPRWSLA